MRITIGAGQSTGSIMGLRLTMRPGFNAALGIKQRSCEQPSIMLGHMRDDSSMRISDAHIPPWALRHRDGIGLGTHVDGDASGDITGRPPSGKLPAPERFDTAQARQRSTNGQPVVGNEILPRRDTEESGENQHVIAGMQLGGIIEHTGVELARRRAGPRQQITALGPDLGHDPRAHTQ